MVHYDEIRYGGEEQVEIPSELFKSAAQLRVRTDLIDCHVDICSPDVPALFTENFDYADIRRHFVHGILTDTELYGKFVHAKILTGGQHYAARVRSLQTYDAVSRDIVHRWTYPFVPDSNLYSDHSYTCERGNIYKEDRIRMGKDVILGRNTVIGRNVGINDGTEILDSIIGNNVVLGKNVFLDGVYIWDNTVIGDNTTIRHSIIADNVSIGEKVHIAAGCIVASNVSIPNNKVVELGRKIYNPSYADEPSDEDSDEAEDVSSKQAQGEDWDTGSSASDEDEQASNKIDTRTFSRLPTRPFYLHDPDSYSTLPSDYSSDTSSATSNSDSDSDSGHRRKHHPRPGSAASSAATDDESPSERDFLREAIPSLLESMMAGHDASITAMELNSLRMVNNMTFLGVRRAIASALIQRAQQLESPPAPAKRVGKVLADYLEVFTRSLHEKNDQVELLQAAQRQCLTMGEEGPKWMLAAAQAFYDQDLVEEDLMFKWWAIEEAKEGEVGEKSKNVRSMTGALVKWLQEAASESEEESSEEEESEEEESDDE